MEFTGRKYILLVKKRAVKGARITIKPQSGEVIVSVPSFYKQTDIQALLVRHRGWIEKHWKNIIHTNNVVSQILDAHLDEFLVFGEWQKVREKNATLRYFKTLLLEYLSIRVPQIASKMKLRYNKISVRQAKTRLGACSVSNNLSFSLLLVFAPKELIEYVIIHELAHITHKNHSRRFWSLVEVYCPDYQEMRKELHNQVKLYVALLEKIEQRENEVTNQK